MSYGAVKRGIILKVSVSRYLQSRQGHEKRDRGLKFEICREVSDTLVKYFLSIDCVKMENTAQNGHFVPTVLGGNNGKYGPKWQFVRAILGGKP